MAQGVTEHPWTMRDGDQPRGRLNMFEQTFKNIADILHKDAGCTSELDYTEQSSWLRFLKHLDALEHDKTPEAQPEGKTYRHIIDAPFRWDSTIALEQCGSSLEVDCLWAFRLLHEKCLQVVEYFISNLLHPLIGISPTSDNSDRRHGAHLGAGDCDDTAPIIGKE
jgi:hypothetical protein